MKFIKDRMNKEKWLQVRSKGCTRYLWIDGYLKFGVMSCAFGLAMMYWARLDFEFSRFDWVELFVEYYVYLPLWGFYGVVLAWFSWLEYERKFHSNPSNEQQ